MLNTALALRCSSQSSTLRSALAIPSPVSSNSSSGCGLALSACSSRPSAATTRIGKTLVLDIAMLLEPDDRVLESHFDWVLRKTQFANCLGSIEPHLVARHLHAFQWNIGLAASNVDVPEILKTGISFCDPVRHSHLW